jgi:dihydroxyacetone kinase
MLDALIPAIAALKTGDLKAAAEAARGGANATAQMSRARAGRSSYVSAEHLHGAEDPGAVAMALAFHAASTAMN